MEKGRKEREERESVSETLTKIGRPRNRKIEQERERQRHKEKYKERYRKIER